MRLTKNDIESQEEVGTLKGDPITHIKTKGGYHMMALNKSDGHFRVLGQGAHRAIAKAMADKVENGISWHEHLFKTAVPPVQPLDISTPENHKAVADYHAKFSHFHKDQEKGNPNMGFVDRHNHHMSGMYHEDEAVKHYQMAGMDKPSAIKEYQGHKGKYSMLKGKDGQMSFNEPQPVHHASQLQDAYRMKHKSVPKHLPSNWAE